jgi:uncharacterized membrane protein SirB2
MVETDLEHLLSIQNVSIMSVYSIVKICHVIFVILSISGFVYRGSLKMAGSEKLNLKFFKIFPHVIDSLLLLSALVLVIISGMYPWRVDWLGAKLLALLAYIVSGGLMMHSKPESKMKYVWFATALLFVIYIVLVALTKSPIPGL